MNMPECPLCRQNELLKGTVIAQTDDAYLMPAHSSPGNFLIVPETHTESPADLPDNWWVSVKTLLAHIHLHGGYNISINIGQTAGQTVKHIHFWVIPRAGGKLSSGKGLARLISEANSI